LVANRITPTDTGRLRGANETTPIVVQGTKVVAGVENKTSYAMFVHEGTRAHVIEPRNKRVLAWVPRGGTVRVEVQRLVADVLPVGGWDAPQSVPSSVEYSESRMDALLS
ncbi:hypothetical protein ACP3V9_24005, partial [Salmonella enterica]|uniref:hypothetical protein n=1 Tax=Salmonella enterica TaxID=28901 RepID=UPI003CEC6DFD